jgi:hypothetical protein
MTDLMEKSIWTRQKQPIVQGFIDERKKLLSTTAGRGFLLAPGFLYEFETGLELDTKSKLSDLSNKILSDAIDRDMKQAGIDYDLEYKNAEMTWEINKQTLLSAWDKELSVIKQGWNSKEEDLSRMAIEISRRGIFLQDQKVVIELQCEALRNQLAAIEGTTTEYETQLALKKVETAQRKLAVIPFMQQIVAIEQQIIVAEQSIVEKERLKVEAESTKISYLDELTLADRQVSDKKRGSLIPATQELVDATNRLVVVTKEHIEDELRVVEKKREAIPVTQELVSASKRLAEATAAHIDDELKVVEKKKAELIPTTQELVTKSGALATATGSLIDGEIKIADKKLSVLMPITLNLSNKSLDLVDAIKKQIDNEIGIANQKVLDAEIMVEKADKQVAIASSQVEAEMYRSDLIQAKLDLDRTRIDFEVMLAESKARMFEEIKELKSSSHNEIMQADHEARQDWIDTKGRTADHRLNQEMISSSKVTRAATDSILDVAIIEAFGTTESATISAAAKLTAELTHLIG